ncbi:MAG TPA: hypothetical protein VEX60_15980 [Pyrinomonadaceae bacterium]|nr:hypothetical protein [Pyrinomonadaceae bacterium]
MAEERNLGLARAPEPVDDGDATKAELQRRMEETRESISQTVTEIKESVVNQYQQVRETISDTLDWREQYKRHTVPFTVGAFAVGALVGYSVMGAFSGDEDDDYDTEDAAFDRIEQGFAQMQPAPRAYAAAPITGASHAPTASKRASHQEGVEGHGIESRDAEADARPSYSSGYRAPTAPQGLASVAPSAAEEESDEPKGPGLYDRFKETKAYDKLQGELSTLGERFVEELSRTAQAVVVPALLNKLKSLIGIDLSTQREVAQRSRLENQTARSTAATASAIEEQDEAQGRAGSASA